MTSYENGTLKIDLERLVGHLSKEDKLNLAITLSLDDDVVNEVVNQITTGYTSDCSWINPEALRDARKRLTTDEAALRLVEELLECLANADANARHYRESYYNLQRSWPTGWIVPHTHVGSVKSEFDVIAFVWGDEVVPAHRVRQPDAPIFGETQRVCIDGAELMEQYREPCL